MIEVSRVTSTQAYFIKLGRAGEWEADCLHEGTLRFGYHETPHELCLSQDWDAVWKVWKEIRGDTGAATRDVKQIQAFYESDEEVLFITFAGGKMYWCRPIGPVELLADGGRKRQTVDGWHSRSVHGTELTADRLSGQLLKVQMFRGTVCQVKPFEYLLRKLNDELSPEVAAAEDAERTLIKAIAGLLRLLTWQDFELLVDLIFSTSGWRRITEVGRTQKTVDLELVLPTTGERAFVQIKSQANLTSLLDYTNRFNDADIYNRMFFVWHSGNIGENASAAAVTLVGPDRLSQMVLDAGLFSWLRDKVS